ncbi:MAG: UDP-N-acetylmuramoyl-tripeptide--D-alanyl-D-alanine ligase [Candidatus Omnitrophica bacterium]|nr:UDP-N-acetylmuramoyl-tripeptide--D-alanyl-D-alanine ligase [Candidatus Omnitrophota bacterium]
MFKVVELLNATDGQLVGGDKNSFVEGISTDSRLIKPRCAFIAIKGGKFDGHDFIEEVIKKGITTIVVSSLSRGLRLQKLSSVNIIKVKDTTKAFGDIAKFWRKKFKIPVIAVTGSNGKTTTKEMIAHVLSGKLKVLKNEGTKNNHIGVPQTLLSLDDTFDLAVIELGTNHFGEIEYLSKICQPNIGLITNIGSSHLEFLKDLKGVCREKYSLIKNLMPPGIGILNADDSNLAEKINNSKRIFSFGMVKNADFCISKLKNNNHCFEFIINGGKTKFILNNFARHNLYNVLAAIAVARFFGLTYKEISQRFESFKFPAGRFQLRKINNLSFIDDTYNSNPNSFFQAMEAFADYKTGGRKIVIMGDMLELGKNGHILHKDAGRHAADVCDVFIGVGELSRLAAGVMEDSGFDKKNIFTCDSSQKARDILRKEIAIKEEDVILVKGSRSMKMEEVFK